jgi:ribosome-binding protein aMBF1 (putative translation factor)
MGLSDTPISRRQPKGEEQMPTCKGCDDEVDKLVSVKVDGKARKLCEDCADRARESAEIAEQSEAVVQQMMGFKGRR